MRGCGAQPSHGNQTNVLSESRVMAVIFGGFESSKVIWEACQIDYQNQAMLQILKDGRYYLIVNDEENAKHILFDRNTALQLVRAIESAEIEQGELF